MTTVADFEPWSADVARDLVAGIAQGPGPVLLCLQAIQDRFGYVPADSIGLVAEACNVSRADVHGVFTFYSDLRSTPPPAIPVRLCAAEACQAVGSRKLQRDWHRACETDPQLADATGVDEPIFCLGNCALGPAALVGQTLLGRANVDSITREVRAQSQGVAP
jgi:formate dehydrogenase subunit gamma